MHHFGSGTRGCKYLSQSIQPYFCSLHCLQWILFSTYLFFLSMKLALLLSPGISFSFLSENLGEFLSRLQAGWCVHVQSKIIDQSFPRVICIHTTLDGNKIKFCICTPTLTHTHAIIDQRNADLNVLIICVTAMEWVCEHYGLYGGCHVTSPLDYYHRKEMTLSRQEADPQYNYIYTTPRRSPDSKESRAQLVQTSDVRQKIQNNREHFCWSAVVTPISGNGDIKWCCNTNNGSRPPWHCAGHGASSSRLQRKLNKQSAFDTMSFKHVGNNDVHNLH